MPLLLLSLLFLLLGCEQKAVETGNTTVVVQPRTGQVAGTVFLAGQNDHSGTVVYLSGTSYSARTAADGTYRIDGIPAGMYSVIAEKTGYQQASIGRVELAPDNPSSQTVLLRDEILEREGTSGSATTGGRLGSITGTVLVREALSGEDVIVRVEGTQWRTTTDSDGLYHFINIEPGAYSLSFARRGYSPYSLQVTVNPGDTVIAPQVSLEPAGGTTNGVLRTGTQRVVAVNTDDTTMLVRERMTGTRRITGLVDVTDVEGNRVTDMSRVTVSLDNSDYIVTPDDEGHFQLVNLPAGIYTVLGTLDEGRPVREVADLTVNESAQVVLKIAAAEAEGPGEGTVIGTVILPGVDDAPLPDASGVSVAIAGTQLVAVTAKNGRFKIDNVPAGTQTIVATKDGFLDATRDGVLVEGGQTANIGDLLMEPKRDYPKVIGTTPKSGERDVIVDREFVIQIKFNKKMDADSVKDAISITPAAINQLFFGRGSHPMADDETLVIVLNNLDERRPIKYNTTYRVLVARSASDTDGLGMEADFLLSFTTGSAGVTGTTPQNGETAYVDQGNYPVGIFFNTKLDPRTVTADNFRVRPNNGTSVHVQTETDPRTGWTTVRLRTLWQEDTQYTITVTSKVRASNGQRLGNVPYTFKFKMPKSHILQEPIQVIH